MSNYSEIPLILNQEKKRFELEVEGVIAFIDFIVNNENIMFLTHTEVPKELEGKGVGSALVSKTLNHIQEKGYTLAPLCPFVAAYLKRHPEWKNVLAKGYNIQ
ncbi:GNAT family N-acetyltransferase [Flavobacterium luminosum]|uniref:N-acetyltransferase n=1 Tax=Flavobacterium luminosum TaxID=2949086 RepID=A0ABT0TLD7_9FLAO|nr:GNAT family N-acetyltransferase [Flavobacterium sp. HXWNR70]MCL9808126.1 N-acetyltransferase [Flavobacterium sp. HXWNR70]